MALTPKQVFRRASLEISQLLAVFFMVVRWAAAAALGPGRALVVTIRLFAVVSAVVLWQAAKTTRLPVLVAVLVLVAPAGTAGGSAGFDGEHFHPLRRPVVSRDVVRRISKAIDDMARYGHILWRCHA